MNGKAMILAIGKFRADFAVRVDPLCLDVCFVGDMFEHLWTLVFIAHLSHEEADLVERVRYLSSLNSQVNLDSHVSSELIVIEIQIPN